MAGAEVVERDANAELLQLVQRAHARLRTLHRTALGDLQLEKSRREAGLVEDLRNTVEQVRLLELTDGEIDCERQRAISGIVPGLRLRAGDSHRPRADRDHDSNRFGERNEHGWRDHAEGGVIPAEERFHSADSSGAEIENRLVVDRELLIDQRFSQSMLERDALQRFRVDERVEELIV